MVIMLSLISISNPAPSQQVDRWVLKADLSYGAATDRFDHKADVKRDRYGLAIDQKR